MDALLAKLSIVMADTYAIYLKTQNYHWHVKGKLFKALHDLFETQYKELGEAVDLIAERMRALNYQAPATFKEFELLKRIIDGDANKNANEMVMELVKDHKILIQDLNQGLMVAAEMHDEGTATMLSDRIVAHEKMHWMLHASCE